MSKKIPLFLFFLTFIMYMQGSTLSAAQSCRWDGTAPFCDGECDAGESEITRAATADPHVQSLPSTNTFGNSCTTGTKAYCCKTPGRTCYWSGTAPFCDGECTGSFHSATPPSGSSSGASCWTGSKAYCCSATGSTGSSNQGLQASVEFSRYAAIWEKKSGPALVARHGLTSTQYQAEFDKLAKQGYRLIDISGYGVGAKDYYAAIWEMKAGPALIARHAMSPDQYQEEFNKLSKQGYRLVRVNGYSVADKVYYAAIWEQGSGPAWVARHGLTSIQYQQEFEKLAKQGYRLANISGYSINGQDLYAAIWRKDSGASRVARHGLNSAQYQDEFNKLGQQGYRLVDISAWGNKGTGHYAAIWEKSPSLGFVSRHGMLFDSYQEVFNYMAKDGFRLAHVSGYYSDN